MTLVVRKNPCLVLFNDNGIPIVRHNYQNNINKHLNKTHSPHNQANVRLRDLIIIFFHIKLKNNITSYDRRWIISWVSIIFSEILLPFTNPDWFKEIKFGRIGASLRYTNLEVTLLTKLFKLIGLNSAKLFGLLVLGSNTR